MSVAESVTAAMTEPETSVWAPWPATATVLVMVQVNEVEPVWPAESVAVTVTGTRAGGGRACP